jgi:uncharacterized protein (TIGR03435 family)
MKIVPAIALALLWVTAANSQTSETKLEFDAASIKPAPPQTGHFPAPPSAKGGPGTADPSTFRCSNCTVAFLISKAFELERYQFPGQGSLPAETYDVVAKVPSGATPGQFAAMLQNLLEERFKLAGHFETKQLQGYELVVAKNGPKLTESKEDATKPVTETPAESHGPSAGGDWHSGGGGASRPGLTFFNGQAKYRGDHQTMAELARVIATQLAKPVDDRTGLTAKYDISLSWNDDGAHAATHPGGAWSGGDHGGHGGDAAPARDDASGPTLFGALQTELGLKLEAKKATAKVFVVEHVEKSPTSN